MRPWLLGLVCILLVADGYWVSRNLVLKSADDGIFWFRPRNMFAVSLLDNKGERFEPPPEHLKFEVSWVDGRWTNNGRPISDVRNFIEYAEGEFPCSLTYSVKSEASIQATIQSIKTAFAAGAGSVLILDPLVERDGKVEDSALLYENWGATNCPYQDYWSQALDRYDTAFGYPPDLKKAEERN